MGNVRSKKPGDLEGVPGLGERLKFELEWSEDTVKDIAELSGISRAHIYEIIKNDNLTAYNLYKLCKVLEVSADWLLFGTEEMDFLKGREVSR